MMEGQASTGQEDQVGESGSWALGRYPNDFNI